MQPTRSNMHATEINQALRDRLVLLKCCRDLALGTYDTGVARQLPCMACTLLGRQARQAIHLQRRIPAIRRSTHRDDVDVELRVGLQHRLVGEGLEADLVERIRGVGDELPEEDLLVGVERVNDEGQQLVDFCEGSETRSSGVCGKGGSL